MKKNSLIIAGVGIAIALGAISLYLQIGEEISSNLSAIANPCLSLYDFFRDELMSKGFFDSETTMEVQKIWVAFYDPNKYDCLSDIDSWLPSERQNERNFLEQIKQRMQP